MTTPLPKSLRLALLLLGGCSAGTHAPGLSATAPPRSGGLVSAAAIPAVVGELTSRAPENVQVTAGPIPGSKLMRIQSGFGEVMLGRANPDGSFSTRCVESAQAADAFLSGATPDSPPKAAQ